MKKKKLKKIKRIEVQELKDIPEREKEFVYIPKFKVGDQVVLKEDFSNIGIQTVTQVRKDYVDLILTDKREFECNADKFKLYETT